MATVVREDIDELTLALNINISQDDYAPKFKQEMENHRKKSHMKGFRKGKTPMALIRKMYGRAVMADVVNEAFQKELFAYLENEKLEYLGQPIPAEGEVLSDFDPNNLKDYSLKFELGLAPDFEIKGIGNSDVFNKMVIEVPNEDVEEEFLGIRKRLGVNNEVDDSVQEKDMVKIDAEELEEGKKKEGGWATSFSVLFDEQLNPSFYELIKGKKKGTKIKFKVSEIEKDRDADYVRKYFLNVEEADKDTAIGDDFEGTITAVERVTPAEVNQEFLDKAFGEGKVENEAGAKENLRGQIEGYFAKPSEQLLQRDIQKAIIEQTEIALPEAFLKRWLKMTEEKSDEQLNSDFPNFTKGLKWTLIRRKLIESENLEVSEEEMLEGFKDRIRSYFGGYGDELVILNTANRLMEDQKQADQMYQELITEKLFGALSQKVTVAEETVSKDTFNERVQKIQEEDKAAQANVAAAQEEEAVEEIEE